ncbi:hypothetical protein EKO04_008501 [Ascochyta lentis]|uniref:Uncharacterized protein n=1 Tax=Ascochyta lentis TaxID=205686 RepID=A0A8H7MFZ3_9PLEO|nr:hypothetical protein EKO04_008501 [Ascochyta lentis]
MSSRLLRRPARQLLSWSHAAPSPPATCPPARGFHASAPRQDPVLDALLYLPHEMMTLIHTQAPWYAAIPASAFLLRGALVTSFGTWARSLMARYIGLQPLRQALARQKRDDITRQGNFRTPKEAVVRIKQEIKQEVTKLDSRWKVTLKGQLGWTLIQIPIFFTMAEVIRKMCGARDGLLALGTSVFRSKATADTTEAADAAGATDASAVTDGVGAIDTLRTLDASSAVDVVDVSNTDGLAAMATSPFFEPSLANEGMLWFQDLILPDPTGALPFIVSGLMFSNIYFTKNTVTNEKTWPNYIRRVLLGVSLLIGPLCQGLPSALMLYWASSTSSVMLWNAWLDWKYPAPRDFMACKRPLQMPPAPKSRAIRI